MKAEIKSSLDGVKIIDKRRAGNTTRIVDNIIQLLFQGYVVEIHDHIEPERCAYSHQEFIMRKVTERMNLDHRGSGGAGIIKGTKTKQGDLLIHLKY